jgi:hypothetical protein
MSWDSTDGFALGWGGRVNTGCAGRFYDTGTGCLGLRILICFAAHQERTGQPVLPTGDGEILRWLKGECLSMCSGEKSAELKSLRATTAAS